MNAVALTTRRRQIPAELKQEILGRIDRGGLHICEAELRYVGRRSRSLTLRRPDWWAVQGNRAAACADGS